MITEERTQVLNSWNSYFKYDPTDSGSLERKFFGNPFIKPAGEGPMEFAPGERFGCFEVSEEHRSMGIGSKILVRTLNSMKATGIRHAYFLWTSEKASHLYLRYGFKTTRKFRIMVLKL